MKKYFVLSAIILTFCINLIAQKTPKPTLTPKEPTPAQEALIKQGIVLHDAKKYDEAIALYQKVLDENSDCVLALYEMALSYYHKKDYVKTIETSMKGMNYDSKDLSLFYTVVGSVWDDQGNPKKAVELYNEGIKNLEKEKGYEHHVSSLYYNLGITYFRQKDGAKAKQAFKKAIEYNYSYNSPHYVLSETFAATRYKVPSLLAAARFLSVETPSPRTKRASEIFRDVVTGGAKKGKDNEIIISLDFDEPKDEGDFSGLSALLGILSVGSDISEENKNLTEEEKFVEKVDSFISFLASDAKKAKSSFVGKNYVPFMLEIKQRNYVKPFAYMVLMNAGNTTAANWVLEKNSKSVVEFMNWAKSYQPPR